MAKVLITGAGGYIGSVAASLFLDKGYDVVAVDNFSTGFRGPLELLAQKHGDKLSIHEVDLKGDISPIFEQHKDIDAVIHYAASCVVDESMKDPAKYFENNIGVTSNLMANLDKYGIKNIVFSSTCAVYGNAQYVPIDEKHPTSPANPYGESKLIAERIIQWFQELKGINYVILRYFNICGATDDGTIGDSKKPSVHLMQNAVRGAMGIEPFYLTHTEFDTTPDRSPIRDYINVVDLNMAHLKAVEYLIHGGKSEIINLGTGTGNTVLEVVKKVEEITGKEVKHEKSSTPRQGEYDKMIAKIDKAREVLGWEPTHSIEDSVKSLVTWYTTHPNGWEK